MKSLLLNLADRLVGKRGWILTLVGMALCGVTIAMLWHEKIGEVGAGSMILLGGSFIVGRLPEKK